MDIKLMNMIMIKNTINEDVVVLDKKKKEGWEGLTFPGGKVEELESINDSVIREAKEETNLDIKNIKLVGSISWIYKKDEKIHRDLGLLYETTEFQGDLVENNREGKLFWKNYDQFKNMKPKSDSMDYILKIYDRECSEVVMDLINGRIEFY
ncbi:MAG: NUDIX domain-containing protein [Tissierellia bacterium]|nr:NUDIX domain-containing protein [Tissierellia bacterium]